MSNVKSRLSVTAATAVLMGIFGTAIMSIAEVGIAAPPAEVPKCPENYPVEGIELTRVPQGWVGNVSEKLALDFVTVVEGSPAAKNHIAADMEVDKTDKGLEVEYSLQKNSKPRWLACNYGKLGTVQLYRALPESFKQCTVKYLIAPNNNEFLLSNYTCK